MAFLPQTFDLTPLWSVYHAEHSIPPSNLWSYTSVVSLPSKTQHSSLKQCYTSVVSLPSRTWHSSLKPSILHLCGQFTTKNTAFLPQTFGLTPLWSVYQAEHSILPSNLWSYTSVVSLPSKTQHSSLKQCYTSVVSLPSRTWHSSLKPSILHLCGQFTTQNTAFLHQTFGLTPLWSVYQAEHSILPSNLWSYTSVVSLPSRTQHSSLKPLVLHLCGQFTKQNTAFLPQTFGLTPLWSVYQAEHSILPSNLWSYTSVVSLPHRTQHSSLKPLVLHLCGQFTKQNTAFLPQTFGLTPLWSVYQAEHSILPSNLQIIMSVT